MKKEVKKVKRTKKSKIDKTVMNIWVIDGEVLSLIKIPTKLRMEFIREFGTEKLSDRLLVENWLNENV